MLVGPRGSPANDFGVIWTKMEASGAMILSNVSWNSSMVYVSSPSGVWGGAPAANDLAAFWTEMEASGAMILSSVMDFINGM